MALRDNVRPKVPDTATERALLDGRGAFLADIGTVGEAEERHRRTPKNRRYLTPRRNVRCSMDVAHFWGS